MLSIQAVRLPAQSFAMPTRTFADLPVELIFHICSLPPNTSILLIARLSKAFYQTVTPILYERLNLKKMSQARRCFTALESSPKNLPFLVKSVSMPTVNWWPVANDLRESFHDLFVRCILRMQNLQEFNCSVPGQMLPDMWVALTCNKSLQSIRVSLPSIDELEGVNLSPLLSLNPIFPSLHTFEFTQMDMKPHVRLNSAYERFISSLIQRHSHQLRIIRVQTESINRDYLARLLPQGEDSFPLLDVIATKPSLLTQPIISQFRTARTITLTPPTSYPPLAFSLYTLPHLQNFTGSSEYLKALLDPHAKRPIHTLRLNGAFFQDPSSQGLSALREIEWPDFFEEMEVLPNSYMPIRHLAFHCQSIDFKTLPELAPYICTLETLLICLSSEPRNAHYIIFLGKRLLSYLPNLHTFLLSDAPMKVNKPYHPGFTFSMDISFQRQVLVDWQKSCPGLRKVALASDSIWVKQSGRWVKS